MKHYIALSIVFLLLVAASASGCSGAPTSSASSDKPPSALSEGEETPEAIGTPNGESERDEGVPPTPVPATEKKTKTPTASSAQVDLPPEYAEAVKVVDRDLARRLRVSPDEIRVVSVVSVDWPDTSLGCLRPGSTYSEVITPGFRVILEFEG